MGKAQLFLCYRCDPSSKSSSSRMKGGAGKQGGKADTGRGALKVDSEDGANRHRKDGFENAEQPERRYGGAEYDRGPWPDGGSCSWETNGWADQSWSQHTWKSSNESSWSGTGWNWDDGSKTACYTSNAPFFPAMAVMAASWQQAFLGGLCIRDLVDQKPDSALGDDVGCTVANLDRDNGMRCVDAEHGEQVHDGVCAPTHNCHKLC